jgi:hypothetical protein
MVFVSNVYIFSSLNTLGSNISLFGWCFLCYCIVLVFCWCVLKLFLFRPNKRRTTVRLKTRKEKINLKQEFWKDLMTKSQLMTVMAYHLSRQKKRHWRLALLWKKVLQMGQIIWTVLDLWMERESPLWRPTHQHFQLILLLWMVFTAK